MTTPASSPLDSVRCVQCGYALVAPEREHDCPECGAPAALAIDGPFDARAMQRIRRGAVVFLACALLLVVQQGAGAFEALAPSLIERSRFVLQVIDLLTSPRLNVLLMLGVGVTTVLLTTRAAPACEPQRARQVARGVSVAYLSITLGSLLAHVLTPGAVQSLWTGPNRPFRLGALVAMLLLLAIGSTPLVRRFGPATRWWLPGLVGAGALATWALPVLTELHLGAYTVAIMLKTTIISSVFVCAAVWVQRIAQMTARPRLRGATLLFGAGFAAHGLITLGTTTTMHVAYHTQITALDPALTWLGLASSVTFTIQLIALCAFPVPVLQLIRPPAPTLAPVNGDSPHV